MIFIVWSIIFAIVTLAAYGGLIVLFGDRES